MIGKLPSILTAIFTLLLSSVLINAQETEIESLIKAASLDTQKGAIADYTYQMHFARHGGGSKMSRLYEAMLPSRLPNNRVYRHPLIMIEENEKPLSYELIKRNRDIEVRDIVKMESETSELPSTEEFNKYKDGGYWTIAFSYTGESKKNLRVDILKLMENSSFSNLSHKEINGRKTAIIQFTPASRIKLDSDLSYLDKIEGLVWIDELDKRVTRVEGYSLGSFSRFASDPNAEKDGEIVFLFDQIRVNDGFWFPKKVRLNFSRHPEIDNSLSSDTEFTFNKYQHFKAIVNGFETNSESN